MKISTEFGYAGRILKLDLSSGSMTGLPTSNYADKFIGGLGTAAKIYWDELKQPARALDFKQRRSWKSLDSKMLP